MSGKSVREQPFQFATEDLPEKDRLAIWTEEFGKVIVKVQFETIPGRRFFQSATLWQLPGLSMIAGAGGGYRASRPRSFIAGGSGDFFFQIHLEGVGHLSQFGRELAVGAAEAVLLSSEEVSSAVLPNMCKYITIGVPRQALLERLPNPEDGFMRLISGSSGALSLLAGYLPLLAGAKETEALAPVAVNHVHDLCAFILRPTRDVLEQGKEGIKAARLLAIKKDIQANLSDPGLSLTAVAARHGVSPRYVRMLFEPEGVSFSEFLLSERLEQTHRMLGDPRFAGHAVAQIAYETGFVDLSYFNRCFRKRYGKTPSDVRAAVKRSR